MSCEKKQTENNKSKENLLNGIKLRVQRTLSRKVIMNNLNTVCFF